MACKKMIMVDIHLLLTNQEIHTAERGIRYYNVGLDARKPDFVSIEKQRLRQSCASANSDQYLFIRYKQNFKILASLCS